MKAVRAAEAAGAAGEGGTSLTRKRTPPYEHHRALGMVLLKGPRGALFLMSEVPL